MVIRGREKTYSKSMAPFADKNDKTALKSPLLVAGMLFDKSFHHRYSKGKCHPNPHGITMNSKYTGPTKSAN